MAMGRRRRARELARRLAELDEWDARYGLGGAPPGHPLAKDVTPWRYHSPDGSAPINVNSRPVPVRGQHRHRRRRRRVWPAMLTVLGLAGAGVVAVEYPDEARSAAAWALHSGERILGTAVDPTPALAGTGTGQELVVPERVGEVDPVPVPPLPQPPDVAPPPPEAAPEPAVPEAEAPAPPDVAPEPELEVEPGWDSLPPDRSPDLFPPADRWVGWRPATGERILPAVEPGTVGAYVFLGTQPGTDEPVGFSPCGSIPVVVNPDGAPTGYAELVQGSLDRVSAASGLHLVLVGETDEPWMDGTREAGLPILVTWADAHAIPRLGESAGLATPSWHSGPDGRWWAASGQVLVDPALLPTPEALSAVLDHEFAHVVGLGHVGDPYELMSPVNTGQLAFGPGDLAGLAALGSIPCPSV